jgi:hypothetical protein
MLRSVCADGELHYEFEKFKGKFSLGNGRSAEKLAVPSSTSFNLKESDDRYHLKRHDR